MHCTPLPQYRRQHLYHGWTIAGLGIVLAFGPLLACSRSDLRLGSQRGEHDDAENRVGVEVSMAGRRGATGRATATSGTSRVPLTRRPGHTRSPVTEPASVTPTILALLRPFYLCSS